MRQSKRYFVQITPSSNFRYLWPFSGHFSNISVLDDILNKLEEENFEELFAALRSGEIQTEKILGNIYCIERGGAG